MLNRYCTKRNLLESSVRSFLRYILLVFSHVNGLAVYIGNFTNMVSWAVFETSLEGENVWCLFAEKANTQHFDKHNALTLFWFPLKRYFTRIMTNVEAESSVWIQIASVVWSLVVNEFFWQFWTLCVHIKSKLTTEVCLNSFQHITISTHQITNRLDQLTKTGKIVIRIYW